MARNVTPPLFFDLWCLILTQWLSMVYILQQRFQITAMTLESKVKVKYMFKIHLTTRNANSSFIFLWRVLIYSTTIAYAV